MKINERTYQKLLAGKPFVKANKQHQYLEILWKIRTNGYLKPVNFEER